MYTMGGCDARFWVESLVGGAQVNPAGCQQGEVWVCTVAPSHTKSISAGKYQKQIIKKKLELTVDREHVERGIDAAFLQISDI